MEKYIFPEGFLWGAATAAYQIEGRYNEEGKGESIWDRFSHTPGKVHNGDTGDIACDHFHLYKKDVEIMKEIGLKSYRFSFAWTRILPDGTGYINRKGLDFYKRLVDELLKAGIVPNATLYHWDLPQKLQDKGGWVNRDIINYFNEYACLLFREFENSIPMWATINEPFAVFAGYTYPYFAPGIIDVKMGKQVAHNLLVSHGMAVKSFREANAGNAKIGIVTDLWKSHPVRDCDEDRELAREQDERNFYIFLNPIYKGKYTDYIIKKMEDEGSLPDIREGDMQLISTPMDFQGINCYSRHVVSADRELVNIDKMVAANPEKYMGFNWEIYPPAIYDAVMLIKNEFNPEIPIYITENGGSFDDRPTLEGRVNDAYRIKLMQGYLKELHRAVSDGANVKGYYVWSLMDNFEWAAGFSKRFGILYTDYETQQRIWKDSAFNYKKVINDNAVEF